MKPFSLPHTLSTSLPQIYLSPDDLLACSSARSNRKRGAPEPDWTVSHSEVVVLIGRGGAGGDQTFAEAAATAACAVASVPLPPRRGFRGSQNGGGGSGGGGGRCCRCVGVIIANNRAGHEVFPMANDSEKEVRAPYPVVMVSQESGQLLKGSLAETSLPPSAISQAAAGTVSQFGAGWGVPAGADEQYLSRLPDYFCGDHAGWDNGGEGGGGGGGRSGGVIVSLGASRHCPAPVAPSDTTGACSCSTSSPATSTSSAASYGEEEDGDFEASRFTRVVSAGEGYGWAAPVVGYPFPHASAGYEVGSSAGAPFFSGYAYNLQSNAVAAQSELMSRTRNCAEDGMGGGGAGAGDGEPGEWKREKTLYHAKTLPVRFTKSIW